MAGAPVELAIRVGLAMTLLQLGIGVVNDLVDAPADAGWKAGKPIPDGLVEPGAARVVAVGLFAGGVALGWSVSPTIAGLSLVVIGIGLAYDLRLKGTPWSWLPFALGIPILPVYGWLGATGGLPAPFAALVPAAVAAGAALAIGNSLVDVERDRSAGRTSVAAVLGTKSASRAMVLLLGGVALIAVISAMLAGSGAAAIAAIATVGVVPVLAAWWAGGPRSSAAREWAWRIEAITLAVLAIAWVGSVVA
jgi:4-hydroxybenzoate polyprenyltransferase